uniref:Ribosomal protein S9 n=1 Tax=Eustigmatophyceae sp. Mont 10/10-1w TaxID=2506145 RepID=A0A3R5QNB2_9STRA|nr:ribosomal protein S9 [Eustigmatophyceae sp. Mont 10/10-1w]QAA11686.1 ribosomal protein S9 [Eustigmatophyceae sp. Mont 10/10-1w]
MTKEQELVAVGIGRRKCSSARVKITSGNGNLYINGVLATTYFNSSPESLLICKNPLKLFDADQSYDVYAQVSGGGLTGQTEAIQLAVSRALIKLDTTRRPKLKTLGLLRRDTRIKERKKYGLKKARKAPQYSKR